MFKQLRWYWYLSRLEKMLREGLDGTEEYERINKKFRKLNMYFWNKAKNKTQ